MTPREKALEKALEAIASGKPDQADWWRCAKCGWHGKTSDAYFGECPDGEYCDCDPRCPNCPEKTLVDEVDAITIAKETLSELRAKEAPVAQEWSREGDLTKAEIERLMEVISRFEWDEKDARFIYETIEGPHRPWIAKLCNMALRAIPDKEGWQPIETAPKDGRVHLLLWPGRFHPHAQGPEIGFYWNGLRRPWITDGGEWWENEPTHWMPLPPPPNASIVDAHRAHNTKGGGE